MDAKISIDRSINRLQDFVDQHKKARNNPKLTKQVRKAIDIFLAAKSFLKDVDHDIDKALLSGGSVNDLTNTVPFLRAVYSAEDAADTFVISKHSEVRQESVDYIISTGDIIFFCFCSCFCCCFCCCCCCQLDDEEVTKITEIPKCLYRRFLFGQELESSYSSNVFNRKMKKLDDEIKRLEETKGARTNSDIENNNNTRLLSFQNDEDGLSRRQHWERISDFRLEEETQVVGLQHHINDLVLRLIPQLNQQRCDDDNLSAQVIAVVGEGGSGKTTLARTVYNRIKVKRHFTKRAWVRIPSERAFNARRVLVDILEQVNPAELLVESSLTEDALMWRLIKLLFGTRFLIVLDDVNAPHIWESLRFALFPFSQGGKVIITTRNAENLTLDVAYSTLNMGQLNDEESWKLFLNKVQKTEDELNDRNLIEIKEKILNICAGLPSTIVLLGGLLYTKDQTNDEWSRILNRLADHKGIMSSSYEDLPSEVKPCFLYMGLFPRGFEIPVRRLIHLWCAEGFTICSTETNPEILAEMYLEELVIRNMVQVSWRVDGTPKTCCVPSVVYDFFSLKAENVEFLDHHFWSSHKSPKHHKFTFRRLAAYIGVDYSHFSHLHAGHLQSYIAFDARAPITPDGVTQMFRNKIFSNRKFTFEPWDRLLRVRRKGTIPGKVFRKIKFGLLKVLDLEGVFKPQLSYDICTEFPLLRYLGLRSTFLAGLAIGLFTDLESLDVKHTNITVVNLSSLRRLQHVYLNRNRIESLPSSTTLRTLRGLDISDFDYGIDQMRSIKNLTKLGLTCTSFQISKDIADYIAQLTELQSLKLRSIDNGRASTIKLQRMDKHQKLESLYLLGNLQMDVGFFPPNLRKLTLSLSGLENDPMPVLGQLPQLNILRLFSNSYTGTSMTCTSAERFPKLRLLKLWTLPLIKEWIVEKGAMPCLGELEIRSCENLEMPQGLQYVTTLKEIVLTNMPTTFGAAVEESLKDTDVFIRNNTWNSIPFPKSN